MQKTSTPSLGCFLLFCLVSSAMAKECETRCEPGFVVEQCKCVKCEAGTFWYLRSGVGTCERCTAACLNPNQNKNMVEVSSCTTTSNRVCHCKPGFYCPNLTELTCRVPCKPCKNGFTETPSLASSCKEYTEIYQLLQSEEGECFSEEDWNEGQWKICDNMIILI